MMKNIIKNLLRGRESFDYLVESHISDDLFNEGKKFYPKLRFIKVADKYTGEEKLRVFTNYSKNKGSYSLNSFKKTLAIIKIGKTVSWLTTKKNVKNLTFSKSTNSVYFDINKKKFRISDHVSNNFNGVSIIIKWYTTPQEIVEYFN